MLPNAEIQRYRTIFRRVRDILGPATPTCEGCAREIQEALKLIDKAIPTNAALLVVDYQNDFVDPHGSLYVNGAEQLVGRINALINIFSHSDTALVTLSMDWHPENTPHFEKWPRHCVQNTDGAELYDDLIAPYEHCQMFYKGQGNEDAYSAFNAVVSSATTWPRTKIGTLDRYYRTHNVTDIYVCGVATEYCVENTVADFIKAGYKIHLLTDAVAPVDANGGAEAIYSMVMAGAKMDTIDSVVDKLTAFEEFTLRNHHEIFTP